MTARPKPLIGITACLQPGDEKNAHTVGDKYVDSILLGAGGVPVIVPAIGSALAVEDLLDGLDGLLLTGSPSNVEPHHYGAESRPGTLHDPARDATTLPLIRAAIAAGVPLFAICRGHQELNVALGGSLHQNLQELAGRRDHRAPEPAPRDQQYGPAHTVRVTPGGILARCTGGADVITINSLHAQGIDRLAEGLVVEAVAEDGTIEAVRVESAAAFAFGAQ